MTIWELGAEVSVEFAVSNEFKEFDDPPHADNALKVSATVITANLFGALEKLSIGFLVQVNWKVVEI
jgi:hypothetical protein